MDGLTGLPNQTDICTFIDTSASPFAVVFDIDGLVWLNCNYGYHVTDQALIRVANTIQSISNHLNGQTFRIGGDEFLVILQDSSNEQAIEFAQLAIQTVRNLAIQYQRTDNPTRNHLAINAIITQVTYLIQERIVEFREWIANMIFQAKGGDLNTVELIVNMKDSIPTFLI